MRPKDVRGNPHQPFSEPFRQRFYGILRALPQKLYDIFIFHTDPSSLM
jgi:hypothetical protein